MGKSDFVREIGQVYENSPWIAQQAWELLPFSSLESLHKEMDSIVEKAPKQRQLELIRAHPQLGSRRKMTSDSEHEQKQAGLRQLSITEYNHYLKLNQTYISQFGFPFIIFVRGQNKESIYKAMRTRLKNSYESEFATALAEIKKISFYRLQALITNERSTIIMKNQQTERVMFYGKGDVFTYRTYATPLKGVKRIPESAITGKENILFGLNVNIAIGGSQFLTSFTDGDNKLVVATDSMKNFIQRHLSTYQGSTIDGFLAYVAEKFLQTYPQMETVKITGEEIPFLASMCIQDHQLQESKLVFSRSRNEQTFATVETIRVGEEIELKALKSGIKDLQLIKISGNSFADFVRDEYTTLPEDHNRPLFIYLNIGWRYQHTEDAFGETPEKYVLAEQVRDIASTVFHDLNTKSIQQLIYSIGLRILERFPQLAEVEFESQNRTWETVACENPNSEGKVYTEPRPPFGFQRFSLTRTDLENQKTAQDKKESGQ